MARAWGQGGDGGGGTAWVLGPGWKPGSPDFAFMSRVYRVGTGAGAGMARILLVVASIVPSGHGTGLAGGSIYHAKWGWHGSCLGSIYYAKRFGTVLVTASIYHTGMVLARARAGSGGYQTQTIYRPSTDHLQNTSTRGIFRAFFGHLLIFFFSSKIGRSG